MHRKEKTAVYLLIILVAAALLWLFAADFPPLTVEQAFRQKERAQLLGPAEIIGTIPIPGSFYDRYTVGKSGHGYSILRQNTATGLEYGSLTYYPADGRITAVEPPGFSNRWTEAGYRAPFLFFTEQANAARASLRLQYTIHAATGSFEMEANLQSGYYFLFWLDGDQAGPGHMELLQCALQGIMDPNATVTGEITVYDRAGNVLETKTIHYTQP